MHQPSFDGLADSVRSNGTQFLCYTNANLAAVQHLDEVRAFHIIRDPRDICLSTYYSDLLSHPITDEWPQLTGTRDRLGRMSKNDGLMYEIESLDWLIADVGNWDYSQPNVLEIRMEELSENPYQTMLDAFAFLGCVDEQPMNPRTRLAYAGARLARAGVRRIGIGLDGEHPRTVPVEILLGILWEHSYLRLSGGRHPGREDVTSHYRKGTPGDWKRHFTPAHVERFKELYNPWLVKLGYEEDDGW